MGMRSRWAWGKVVRPQYEEDVWNGDEDGKRMEMGKGSDNCGERVNLEDVFRRFKQAQREQQQRQQGGRDESREKDGCWEQRQEIDSDERERLRGGIGQDK